MRGTIFQPWNYHSPQKSGSGQNLWQVLKTQANNIEKNGYTAVWLPPACEAANGIADVGYGIKNWHNLNGTKYGDEITLKDACLALKNVGVNVYHDQVHNHLMGGEIEEDIWCLHVYNDNRGKAVEGSDWHQADIHTKFTELGLNHTHFDAYYPGDNICFILSRKKFEKEAYCDPWGGCDLDYDNVELTQKLEQAGLSFKWNIHTDGYRFDAVKHIRPKGTLNFLTTMRRSSLKKMFAVGEFLHDDVNLLMDYINETEGQISLFDVPLQREIVKASQQGNSYNLAGIFDKSLLRRKPTLAVTYVHSHDDMPPMHNKEYRGHYVGDWFVSQAYALILLNNEGYPMVSNIDTIRHGDLIKRYMLLRTNCTFGDKCERLDHFNTIGWSYSGSHGYNNSMAVVLTNGSHGYKWLPTQKTHTEYKDLTGAFDHSIWTNSDGWAEFECPPGKTSVWVEASKYQQLNDELKTIPQPETIHN